MGRYLLFAFNNCFPKGGWNDYLLSDDSIQKIVSFIEGNKKVYMVNKIVYDEIQLIDVVLGNTVYIQLKPIS